MIDLTERERRELDAIASRWEELRRFVNTVRLGDADGLDDWFKNLERMKAIQGNTSNDLSFVACLLAKRFLLSRHRLSAFDVAAKPQGAPGLDIDLQSEDGQRIVAEIKTTVPYSGARHDLGAQQKASFRKDFVKLNLAVAEYKYFFVTDAHTLEIVNRKYAEEIPGVAVVCLKPGFPE